MKEFELEHGEYVLLEARKHWLLFVADLLPYAIMAVAPFALLRLLTVIPAIADAEVQMQGAIRLMLGVWLLLAWTAAWSSFTKYFLNAWIVTSRRIINIKQRRFFAREVSSLFLNRVQDVTTDVEGVLSSFLGIGDIKVQTAGEEIEFEMPGIPAPERVRNIILEAIPEEAQTGVA